MQSVSNSEQSGFKDSASNHDSDYLSGPPWSNLHAQSFSHVWLFTTQWTSAGQASLSMGFSRQEHWSGLPFPSPGDLPHPGIEPGPPALQADSVPSEPPGKQAFQAFSRHQNHLEWLKHRLAGPSPRISDSVGLQWDLESTAFQRFQDDTGALRPRFTIWESLTWSKTYILTIEKLLLMTTEKYVQEYPGQFYS